jgi:hypothetical protein
MTGALPRDERGRFFSRRCIDPNCNGELWIEETYSGGRHWRCNGLTHRSDCAPLEACTYWHRDGDVREASA